MHRDRREGEARDEELGAVGSGGFGGVTGHGQGQCPPRTGPWQGFPWCRQRISKNRRRPRRIRACFRRDDSAFAVETEPFASCLPEKTSEESAVSR
jgi:hypothetical protein